MSNSLTETSNLARATTTRHGHSSVTVLPVPPPPQHTNVHSTDSCYSQSPSSTMDTRRHSVNGSLNTMVIEFDGASHVVVRPNRIIRGKVILNAMERLYVTRIRVKFRAEEIAIVRIDEGGGSERLHETMITFFETDWKLWGNDATAYSQASWDELEPGKYEFPFALKFPNVNYPPSMEEPKGFCIRYVWTAQVDGPALQSGLKSREYLTPYRPIIVSTPDRQWEFKKTLMRDKRTVAAHVLAKLTKQSYCPDEPFIMHLELILGQSDSHITSIHFKFRKHHEGKMLVQRGTAFREHIRTVLHGQIPISGTDTVFEHDVTFDIPTRLVSPSFTSHHTRVYYDLQFQVAIEQHSGLLFNKSTYVVDFAIPLTIANLPYDHLLRIPGLTVIEFYKTSQGCPQFFNHALEEPPTELIQQAVMMTSTPRDEPPNYFSIPTTMPVYSLRNERKERSVYMTRAAAKGQGIDLLDAMVIPGLFDQSW